jgi:HAD superfamily hydrolase (TIGR01509 family)
VIKAFLFDFDGVVADTEVPTFESWRRVYADHGVELALEDWLPAVGSGSSTSGAFDAVAHLERLLARPVDREAVVARRTTLKEELYARAPLLPGVPELLERARDRGIKTAVVTRNQDERVKRHCDLHGLRHGWDTLICANADPTCDKTELYRHALDVLDVDAHEALAFEDSPSGVRAAKRAGVVCAAVPNEVTRGADFREADVVLASLAGLTIDDVLRAAGFA